MKYTSSIDIRVPISELSDLYVKEENCYKWMKGLEKIEHISGNRTKACDVSQFYFKMGKREMEMKETLKVVDLPKEFTTTYEAKGVYNVVKTSFEAIDAEQTKCITEHEFQFKGFMKVMAFLMPGAFKKQSQKYLEDFKAFAEGQATAA